MNQKLPINKALKLIENLWVGLIFYTLVIFTVFQTATYFQYHDLFKFFHFEMGSFKHFQSGSEQLVRASIKTALESSEGYFRLGGFMTKDGLNPYLSQVGLQGIIFNIFAPEDIAKLGDYFLFARSIIGFIFAFLLGIFLVKSQLEFGLESALISLCLICISSWIIAFSKNLYWLIFIHFFPFILTWCFYDKFVSRNRFNLYLLFIGFVMAIKSLCGYEYLSNIVLSPIVAIVYYEIKWKTPIRQILVKSLSVFVVGCAGFVIAVLIHLGQLYLYAGSWKRAIEIIGQVANARTLDGFLDSSIKQDSIKVINPVLDKFKNKGLDFDNQPILRWLIGFGYAHYLQLIKRHWFLGIKNIYFISFSAIVSLLYVKSGSSKIKAVSVSLMVSIVISLSWGILASPHHLVHTHMNSITYHLPLYLWAFVTIPFLFWRGKMKVSVD